MREDGRDRACPANYVALVGGEDDVAYACPELEGEMKMEPTGDEQGILDDLSGLERRQFLKAAAAANGSIGEGHEKSLEKYYPISYYFKDRYQY